MQQILKKALMGILIQIINYSDEQIMKILTCVPVHELRPELFGKCRRLR